MELSRSHLPELDAGARSAYGRLERALSGLDDAAIREPSLLPSWSRAHVLAHLARNADSHVRLLEAAQRGELVEQYEGGAAGRAADIERGAARSSTALVEDIAEANRRLFAVWDSLPDEVWDRSVNSNLGMRPAWRLVWGRWRELDIHHVDLGVGYEPSDWPNDFVALMLEDVVDQLTPRLPEGVSVELQASDVARSWQAGADGSNRVAVRGAACSLLAWLLGREAAASGLDCVDDDGRPAMVPNLQPWA